MILLNKSSPLPIEFLKPGDCDDKLQRARRAAEAHRRIRYAIQDTIKPGMALSEVVNTISGHTRILLKGETNNGIGFPAGVSLNDCAAHYSTNPGDPEIYLKESDVLKIDYGTHVEGQIMDSAFTVCFDPAKEELLKASMEGTKKSISMVGVDARVCDIGEAVNEVMSSFEVEINGKVIPIKPVRNLNGHSIEPYKIHAGISIPMVNNHDESKITDETFYACETFASTGQGYVNNGDNCSHYMLIGPDRAKIKNKKTIEVLSTIKSEIKGLPFSPAHVEYYTKYKSHPFIKLLAAQNVLEPYPPLFDTKGSFVAQFEHTIYLSETKKEILTKGDDY